MSSEDLPADPRVERLIERQVEFDLANGLTGVSAEQAAAGYRVLIEKGALRVVECATNNGK